MTIRVFTEQQLAEALNNVKSLHEMAPELIAASVFSATPPAAQVQGEQPEVVGSAWLNIYNNGFDHVGPFPPSPGGPVVDEPLMTVAQHERIVADNVRWKAVAHEQMQVIAGLQEQLRAALSAPPAADVLAAIDGIDDFIARCNGDDRGSCESVNVLRRALASSAPPAAGVPVAWFTDWPGSRVYAAEPHGFDEPGLRLSGESIAEQWHPLYTSPTPPASEQQQAVVMPERCTEHAGDRDNLQWARGANWMRERFLHLNPHLQPAEPSQDGDV